MLRSGLHKPLSYRDALIILGKDDGGAVAIADKIAGIGVAAVNVATVGALGFFELREEAVEWGNSVARSLRERVRGISRLDRTERIVAAHAVLVITSFYEALDEVWGEALKQAELTPAERVALATKTLLCGSYQELIGLLAKDELPIPSLAQPFERTVTELLVFYARLQVKIERFLRNLSVFNDLSIELRPSHLQRVSNLATDRYQISFRRLAADVPEFAIWASMTDAQATRTKIDTLGNDLHGRLDSVGVGLEGLRKLLADMSNNSAADRTRQELAIHYRGYLDKPTLDFREAPEGVELPLVHKAYVNPGCRIARDPWLHRTQLAVESWWAQEPIVPDIESLLVGHLTSPQATRAPMVVLGQPGSGKSLLTKLLAARLPASDFLPILVELRAVAADAGIQDQICEAVRQAVGRHVEWPDLAEAAEGALPVVLLDGFDELLQATGVNQADYLERARNFQQSQAELGRPLAIIVTSRTAVADRARFPEGAIAVRLEPFDEPRVRLWLDGWAQANAELLAARDLTPLPAEVALAHGELCGEPLLLLMLALYDAGSNALQDSDLSLGRAELYERLMKDFAQREVRKHQTGLAPREEHLAIERELRQLSIAALAMFNRGQQIVSETELNDDLAALGGDGSLTNAASAGSGFNRALTAAETIVGRFFFVHEPTALRDTGAPESSFEFLHATFGEFLVARLVVHAIVDLVQDRSYQAQRPNPGALDPGLLYVSTSFELLSGRAPIIEFCSGLFRSHGPARRAECRSLLLELIDDALYPHPKWSHAEYQPAPAPLTVRCAAFSANLVILAVLAVGSAVEVCEFFPPKQGVSGDERWYSLSLLWRSQLAEWRSLPSVLRARVTTRETPVDSADSAAGPAVWIGLEDGSPVRFSECEYYGFNESEQPDATVVTPVYDYFADFTLEAESAGGKSLRDSAFFGHISGQGVHPSFWRHVADSGHFVNGVITVHTYLYELALAPPEAYGSEQRSRMYMELLRGLGRADPVLGLLSKDLRHLTAVDAERIFIVLVECSLECSTDLLAMLARMFEEQFGVSSPQLQRLVSA